MIKSGTVWDEFFTSDEISEIISILEINNRYELDFSEEETVFKTYNSKQCIYDNHEKSDLRTFRRRLEAVIGKYCLECEFFGINIYKYTNPPEYKIKTPSRIYAYIVLMYLYKTSENDYEKIYENLLKNCDKIREIINKYNDGEDKVNFFIMFEKHFHFSLINKIIERIHSYNIKEGIIEKQKFIDNVACEMDNLFLYASEQAALQPVVEKIETYNEEFKEVINKAEFSHISGSLHILTDSIFKELKQVAKDYEAEKPKSRLLSKIRMKETEFNNRVSSYYEEIACESLFNYILKDTYHELGLKLMYDGIAYKAGWIFDILFSKNINYDYFRKNFLEDITATLPNNDCIIAQESLKCEFTQELNEQYYSLIAFFLKCKQAYPTIGYPLERRAQLYKILHNLFSFNIDGDTVIFKTKP